MTATSDNIALEIGRTDASIEDDLEELVKLGILKATKVGGRILFGLDETRDSELQKIIMEFILLHEKN